MKSDRWTWIPLAAVLAIHDEQVAEHGGIRGIRDITVIESAIARPLHLAAYEKPDAAALAAAYAFELCANHGFLDGNKRTAYVVAETFLDLNGYLMGGSDEEIVSTVLGVASGVMSEEHMAKWFRSFIKRA